MKAQIILTLNETEDDITLDVATNPVDAPPGLLGVACNYIAQQIIDLVKRFSKAAEYIYKRKLEAANEDMEMIDLTLRFMRFGQRLDVDMSGPDTDQISNIKFRTFVNNIISAITITLEDIHKDSYAKANKLTDKVLEKQAWAQRN